MFLGMAALFLLVSCTKATPTPTPTPIAPKGIISGKVAIGPLCPVEPCPSPQPNPYSSREILLQPRVGEPISFRLSAEGNFLATVDAGTYTVNLTDCVFWGCAHSLPQTVTIEANKTTQLDIVIDTGIR